MVARGTDRERRQGRCFCVRESGEPDFVMRHPPRRASATGSVSCSPLSARSARFGGEPAARSARSAEHRREGGTLESRHVPALALSRCLPSGVNAQGDRRRGALRPSAPVVQNGKDGTTRAWRSCRASAKRCRVEHEMFDARRSELTMPDARSTNRTDVEEVRSTTGACRARGSTGDRPLP